MYEEYKKDVMKIREEMEDHYNMEMKNQIWDYEREKEKKKDMDEMRKREAEEEKQKKNPPSTKMKSVALKEPSKKKKEVPKVPEKKKVGGHLDRQTWKDNFRKFLKRRKNSSSLIEDPSYSRHKLLLVGM